MAAAYYMLKCTALVHALSTPTDSDWGVLDPGTHVLGGEYMSLVYKPGNPARWYVACVPPRRVVVPTHLLLLGRLAVQVATLGSRPSQQQRLACERSAEVLALSLIHI